MYVIVNKSADKQFCIERYLFLILVLKMEHVEYTEYVEIAI